MTLRAYIERRKLRPIEFAGKAGISKSHLSLILAGKRWPSWPTAKQIEKATSGEVKAVSLMRPAKKRGEAA